MVNKSDERDWSPLTDEQLQSYHSNGYLHFKGAFTSEEVDIGLGIIDDAQRKNTPTIRAHGSFTDQEHTLRIRDAISSHQELAYFLDHPVVLGALMSILDSSVQVLGTEIFVRGLHDVPMEGWHTDGGEYLQRLRLMPGSPSLQVKAQIFLTDTTAADSGNFLLIPGSHLRQPDESVANCYLDDLNGPLFAGELPEQAEVIQAAPGDVLIFPYSLWHAVARNRTTPRKTFIFRYGQLWHRPHDYIAQPPGVLDQMSGRLRRMFGDFGVETHPTDYYKPMEQASTMANRSDFDEKFAQAGRLT